VVASRAGTAMSLRRIVAVVALARAGPVVVAAARVRLNAMTAQTSQAAFAVKTPGQVREGGVLQVGVDVLDDGVAAVGLVGGDGVQVGGGEECVEPPRLEQRRLSVASAGVQVGMRRTTRRPWTCSAGFLEENAVKPISATCALETHVPVVSIVDRLGVADRGPVVVADRGDGPFDHGIHAHGHRDVRAGLDRGADQGAGVERRVRPHQDVSPGQVGAADRGQGVADQPGHSP
jgi:hypothetical protein